MQSVAEATASAGLILVLFNASDSAVEPTKIIMFLLFIVVFKKNIFILLWVHRLCQCEFKKFM